MLTDLLGGSPVSYTEIESKRTTVSVYLSRRPSRFRDVLRERLARAKESGLKIAPGTVALRKVRNRDWANSWKHHFHPLEIGSHLLIKPSWSQRRPRRGQAELILDPGLSFGTGQHPTTLFCLRQLAQFRDAGEVQSFLDLGTGSGILAIAAALLGYVPVDAIDFDVACVGIAQANARRNGVHRRTTFRKGDVKRLPSKPGSRWDVVCANLTADLLRSERKRIAARVNPRGLLVLAGILAKEFPTVKKAYTELGLKMSATQISGEWQGGAFLRSS